MHFGLFHRFIRARTRRTETDAVRNFPALKYDDDDDSNDDYDYVVLFKYSTGMSVHVYMGPKVKIGNCIHSIPYYQ